ncbi:Plasmodium exported protein (hyp15), unknown, putative [Plasmodium sp.]|nr:Plasmodium exported protein (hyp15), unknown, putative [Plasmodium sp.]
MNFYSFIFLFAVKLSVLLSAKENMLKEDLHKHDNENSSNTFHKSISRVNCDTKEPVYNKLSKNDYLYENIEKYNKEEEKEKLDKGKSDTKYSKNVLNNKNSEDIFESVKRVEYFDYKNNMIKERNVKCTSNTILKKNSWLTRFKNKLYKMIFKKNKFWRFISGIITVLGDSAIICEIIMVIGCIVKYASGICPWAISCISHSVCTLIIASGGVFGAIILLIILIIVVVWFLVTWLWSHKDMYYETHEE